MSDSERVILNIQAKRLLGNISNNFTRLEIVHLSRKIKVALFPGNLDIFGDFTGWYISLVGLFLQWMICFTHLFSTLFFLDRSEGFSFSLLNFPFSMNYCVLLEFSLVTFCEQNYVGETGIQQFSSKICFLRINNSSSSWCENVHFHDLLFPFLSIRLKICESLSLFEFI